MAQNFDGAIFGLDAGPILDVDDRDDVLAIVEAVLAELGEASTDELSDPARRTKASLEGLCRNIRAAERHRRGEVPAGPSGLIPVRSEMSLLTLGYALAQFRVLAGGFERLAGIGAKTDANLETCRQAEPAPPWVVDQFEAGTSIRNIVAMAGDPHVTLSRVQRWRREGVEGKKIKKMSATSVGRCARHRQSLPALGTANAKDKEKRCTSPQTVSAEY